MERVQRVEVETIIGIKNKGKYKEERKVKKTIEKERENGRQ